MKKLVLFAFAFIAISLASCKGSSDNAAESTDSTVVAVDSLTADSVAVDTVVAE